MVFLIGSGKTKEMKKNFFVIMVTLLILPILPGGCAQEGIDKYITEIGELADNLNAFETQAAQGNWEEAKQSIEQAKIHHANIDAGIDELEKTGFDSREIARGRAASAYLLKAFEVIDHMLLVHMKVAGLLPQMEGLSRATAAEAGKTLYELSELLTIIKKTQSSIESFLTYANDYSDNNPDDAKKLHADTTIPRMEQLYQQLEETAAKFINTVDAPRKT